ncbi:MAG: hypothetical protein DI535_07640 [Citrobacter freundii]|nr:MAG: hypothetical protein DI535_07640 [Citrobacter freundii]
MKRLNNIGIEIPASGENYIKIDSTRSLSEADIAIFCPSLDYTSYSTLEGDVWNEKSREHEGKKLYNKASSAKIADHIKHWNSEIDHFLANGGTLVIILTKKDEFYAYAGSRTVSGTGKNQKVTEHVGICSNYEFLPFKEISFLPSSGKTVLPTNSLVKELFENLKDFFSYETYIKGLELESACFTTKNKDRVLGATLKIKKGHVVFIPNISFDIPQLIKYTNKSNKGTWTDEAIQYGKIFTNCLVEIDKTLRKVESKTPEPIWLKTEQYNLKSSKRTKAIIEKNKLEIEKRLNEIERLKLVLEEDESLKDLLFETGKMLEKAVIKGLTILGYKAEKYDDGVLELDQIIISPEGQRFIGECEGKDSKDIDVSKFRQLLDGLNADFEKETVSEKAYGLLFGNPQRLTNPSERILNFTNKCKIGAKRENIGLIQTEDLFIVCKYIIENSDLEFATKCRKAIFSQLGEVVKFPIP